MKEGIALAAALGAAIWAAAAFAEEKSNNKTPAAEPPAVHAMALEDGKLTGPGADLILGRLSKAQFVLIGEEHGFADAPQIALALARAGRKHGFKHHVVETGPASEEWAGAILKEDGADGLAKALEGRPLALPFLVMREDAELARYFVDNAGRRTDGLWGVDQEFIGSALVHFETLVDLAPGAKARKLAAALLAEEREAFAAGKQEVLFLFTATPETFAELRAAFGKAKRAGRIIDALEESAGIYQAFNTGKNFASNTDRIRLIRRQFLEAYRGARDEAPRAVFKMGAIHLGRGTTFLNTFDLGSLTEGIAAANGLDVLRVAFWPVGGRMTQVTPFSESAFTVVDYRPQEMIEGLSALGITPETIAEDGYTVVPLEPVRRALEQKGLGELSAEMRFLVLGYDLLVTTRSAKPATPLVP